MEVSAIVCNYEVSYFLCLGALPSAVALGREF